MRVYFPGLNGIRAIAAVIVIFFHINKNMWLYGGSVIEYFDKRVEMSQHAVILFFVLSGFLITYLLIIEKERFQTIAIKSFYVRRILRIWPLFFAALILGLVLALLFPPFNVFQHTVSYNLKTAILYALFVPNFATLAGYVIITIAPFWSIGVEEQFYALWPVALKKSKNIFVFLTVFTFLYVAIKFVLAVSGHGWGIVSRILIFCPYDTLAMGGIAAWLYSNGHSTLKILYHPVLQAICWLFFITSCVLGPLDVYYMFNREMYATAFAIIIINVGTNPDTIIKLRGRLFDFLGKISYGMYVLHSFFIVLMTIPLKHVVPLIHSSTLQFVFVICIIMPLTIFASWLSFRYFESPFLIKKEYFSKVFSTNENRNLKIKKASLDTEVLSLNL